MGVTGLWRLVEPSGKPVPLETLENKVLAIDVSIWLHQAIKGFQDSQGAALPNAHLLGIYHRVCKLLYFRIKPIFVFDGGVPHLKKETIIKRQQQRSKKLTEAERIQKQLLTTLLKHTAVKNVLSEKTKATLTSPKTSPTKAQKETDNLYKLPPIEFNSSLASSDEETSESECSPTKTWDLHTINEQSEHFKSLPADVRHDILLDLKETRKQSSWGKIHEMPKNRDDFSGFQMKRLLKRNSVQVSLDEAAKEMGGRSLSLAELEALLKDQGVVTSSGSRIASDENARYLLIKDLKKAMEDAKLQEAKETSLENDAEYKKKLEEAIQLSLQDIPGTSKTEPEVTTFLENFCDGDFQSSSEDSEVEDTVLNKKQLLAAKNYMVEYSGLTPTEIDKIIGNKKAAKKINRLSMKYVNDKELDANQIECSNNCSDSSDDDDLLEVTENLSSDMENQDKEHLEVLIQPNENIQEDDLFSDIFCSMEKSQELGNSSSLVVNVDQEYMFCAKESHIQPIVDNATINLVPPIQTDSESYNTIITATESHEKQTNVDINGANIDIVKSIRLENSPLVENVDQEDTFCAEESQSLNQLMVDTNKIKNYAAPIPLVSETITIVSATDSHEKPTNVNMDNTNLDTNACIENYSEINKEEEIKTSIDIENDSKNETENEANHKATVISLPESIIPSSSPLTTKDLQDMALNLRNEKLELEAGRLANERLANNLTDQIYQEAQELLQLFGVPYILAPMEAEAQCAFLNSINLTDGTITDDSDIWLFGGTTVYKNFFNQRKHVLEYRLERIQQDFKLTRQQMVLLALLVGSDYTTGLQGVGPVTALEIIAKFPPSGDIISGLNRFRNWLMTDKTARNTALRNKLKNVVFTEGFPSLQVVNAYLEPAVDKSEEAFSWAKPDINGLAEFARQKFGWNHIKSEEILKPVIKRMNEHITQRSIKDFFQTKHKIHTSDNDVKMSKRVKKAVETIGKGTDDALEEYVETKPKSRKKKHSLEDDSDFKVLKKVVKQSKTKVKEIETDIKEQIKKPKVIPDLHKKEVIPQKEQDKIDALRSKLKAIEVLRKSQAPKSNKRRKPIVRKHKADAELSESSSD